MIAGPAAPYAAGAGAGAGAGAVAPAGGGSAAAAAAAADAPPAPNSAAASLLRFEDLTVDDDLPPVERVVRYVRSGIALQRLVHVKMLGEAARIGGTTATLDILLPLLPSLVVDPESIIRQHLATQLLPLGLTCMYDCPPGRTVLADVLNAAANTPTTNDYPTSKQNGGLAAGLGGGGVGVGGGGGIDDGERAYHTAGYQVLTERLVPLLTSLLGDPDVDVRRSASDALASLGMHLRPSDVETLLLPPAIQMSRAGLTEDGAPPPDGTDGETQTRLEDLRITSSNLLADLASLPPPRMRPDLVSRKIVPAVLGLCAASEANGFRVRRSAVQALPRVLAACPEADARERLLPAFDVLSRDDMYRVRKSAGECLVDMSRSLMLAPGNALRSGALGSLDALLVGGAAGVGGGGGKKKKGPIDLDDDIGDIPLTTSEDEDRHHTPEAALAHARRAVGDMAERMRRLRRVHLVPVAVRLLSDANKFVRHGMMQFLGPFIASFYPLEGGGGLGGGSAAGSMGGGAGSGGSDGEDQSVMDMLENEIYAEGAASGNDTSEASSQSATPATQVGGVGVQFFPHANGMVSRLNPSNAAAAALSGSQQQFQAPGGGGDKAAPVAPGEPGELRSLLQRLPPSLLRSRRDASVLDSLLRARTARPPSPDDLAAVRAHLLPHFVGLSDVESGDPNVDAEMRVYCAYSLPAVVLLLGREGWDPPLRRCFLNLVLGGAGEESLAIAAEEDGEAKAEEGSQAQLAALAAGTAGQFDVPLPVKRCLASSFHTVCHILGRDVAFGAASGSGTDTPVLLKVFETRFLRDTDDTVRLNVLRNLPHLLGLMNPAARSTYLPRLHDLFLGDDLLGAARRRSATSPMLLNWRQRDAVAQILPDLAGLFNPGEVRRYIWPVAKALLGDKISAVREDVEWCLPAVLRRYAPEHCRDPGAIACYQDAMKSNGGKAGSTANSGGAGPDDEDDDDDQDENDPFAPPKAPVDPKVWSAEACDEVISHLKTALLLEPAAAGRHGDVHDTARGRADTNCGAFTKRQEYCRICGILGTALRLGELDHGRRGAGGEGDAHSKSSKRAKSRRHSDSEQHDDSISTPLSTARHAYADLSSGERRLLRRLLVRCFLPDALHMRDDRVSNVRLTLMGALRAQPPDVRDDPRVVDVLTTLEEEVHTWEGGWENDAMWGAAAMGVDDSTTAAAAASAATTAAPSSSSTTGGSAGSASASSKERTGRDSSNGGAEEPKKSKLSGRAAPPPSLSLQEYSQSQQDAGGATPPPTSPAGSSVDGESSLASI